ncbi:TetR-like C-terminal domain-containing protein [Nonomuraea mangrovi]|uniref:TetR-like C-terminal domain-containing protein n=1 Tax=Nonomuraea mangrovi TaxID=2316207 RepID=A0ABW4ST03_9ACTN
MTARAERLRQRHQQERHLSPLAEPAHARHRRPSSTDHHGATPRHRQPARRRPRAPTTGQPALELPLGAILRELLSAAGGASEFLAQLQEQSGDAAAAPWLTILGRAVARGEASPEALHPRVATVAIVLLRNEFVVRGVPTAPDDVLVEIVDEVYLPLVRRRGLTPK